jgi:hypothetical protein
MGSAADPDFDVAVLGGGLPPMAEAALQAAGSHRGTDPIRAMALLMKAQDLAPEHPAVLIAFYRHHFYGHRLAAARDVARRALVVGARALGLPVLWRELPRTALHSQLGLEREAPRTDARLRFYLFTLKGYAYLSLRLDDLAEAGDALAVLRDIDPDDCVGGALLETVRLRALAAADGEDIDDQPAPAAVFGAAAWARTASATASAAAA